MEKVLMRPEPSRHGRDNPARVDAPREENAQGDIGGQVAADCVIEPLAKSSNPFRLGQAGAGSRLRAASSDAPGAGCRDP